MKAEMSEDGVITIRPESALEAYALRQWSDKAFIAAEDVMRAESGKWKSSAIKVAANWPQEQTR